MLRIVCLLIASWALTPLALACNMDSAMRASDVAGYVADAALCLNAPPQDFRFDETMERSFVTKINEERKAQGLSPLAVRQQMRPAARFHSLDMGVNAYFGHKSQRGKGHAFRISAFDRTLLAEGSAENVAQFGPAKCIDSLQQIVDCAQTPGFVMPQRSMVTNDLHTKLMASKGHRRNILDPEMTHIAVGVARTDSGFYVTQVFAKQVGELDIEVPLLMSAAEYVTMVANVPGWTVTNFALSSLSDPVDLIDNLIGPDFVGEHNIRVRAEKIQTVSTNGSLRTITHWIYPSGPAVTIKGARES